MLTKSDCMSILVKLEDKGLNINEQLRKLAMSKEPPLDVLKFIVESHGTEVNAFYEILRKSHNAKRSPLYKNIVAETLDADEAITTLNCYLTQILLHGKHLDDDARIQFYKEVRAEEISRVLHTFFADGLYDSALALLKLIRADILVVEYLTGRREAA